MNGIGILRKLAEAEGQAIVEACMVPEGIDLGPNLQTTRDSRLYMQGFEDGQAMGRVSAELQAKAERAALAAHWEDGE